jgi:hypothetical protein
MDQMEDTTRLLVYQIPIYGIGTGGFGSCLRSYGGGPEIVTSNPPPSIGFSVRD